ncbi:MAG: hypothetical protein AB7I04_01495 [Pseudomonadales bacterium]
MSALRPTPAWLAIALAAVVAGCATSPVMDPQQVPEESTPPAPVPAADEPAEPEAGPGPRFDGAPVIVVVDDARGRELEVLQVFSARLGRPYTVLNLAHRTSGAVSARLAAAAPVDVIALGPAALAAASGIRGVQVVHAAVFEAPADTRSVDALPPFGVQLDYWLRHNPDLGRLGVIGSPRMASRMTDLADACRARGLTLEQRTVDSDQALLLAFRSLVPRIDGFIFLPDESVLSPSIIEQVIAHGRRNRVQTLVYSPVMFNLGATLYVQPDPVGVAQSLIALVENGGTTSVVREMRVRSRLQGDLVASTREGVGY